jgi:ATP-dependent helicase YprA (DUF1998 family)
MATPPHSALELGVDVGSLDATSRWLPRTIASLWQQAGRAGRSHTVRLRYWRHGNRSIYILCATRASSLSARTSPPSSTRQNLFLEQHLPSARPQRR